MSQNVKLLTRVTCANIDSRVTYTPWSAYVVRLRVQLCRQGGKKRERRGGKEMYARVHMQHCTGCDKMDSNLPKNQVPKVHKGNTWSGRLIVLSPGPHRPGLPASCSRKPIEMLIVIYIGHLMVSSFQTSVHNVPRSLTCHGKIWPDAALPRRLWGPMCLLHMHIYHLTLENPSTERS